MKGTENSFMLAHHASNKVDAGPKAVPLVRGSIHKEGADGPRPVASNAAGVLLERGGGRRSTVSAKLKRGFAPAIS